MSDPMMQAAQHFGGQFAEQQKEKVSLLNCNPPDQILCSRAIDWDILYLYHNEIKSQEGSRQDRV